MNARFLLLPALAFFVALSGCDSGAPSTDGFQTSTTVPTASAISGPTSLGLGCTGTYTANPSGGSNSYFDETEGLASLNQTSNTTVDVTRIATDKIVLEYRRASGTLLFTTDILYDDVNPCP